MSELTSKREAIVEVAAGLFARYGFRKTTVADVIRSAGVARATVYKYFPTKEDIFQAVIHMEMRDMLLKVREEVAKKTKTRDRLRAAAQTHGAEIRKKVNVYRLTMKTLSDVIPVRTKEAEELGREALQLYSWILSEGVKAGEIVVDDAEATAWSILLALKGLFMPTLAGELDDRSAGAIDTLMDLIWNGLKPREETT